MANRSMTAKVMRAVKQRQEAGAAEGCKLAYHTNKPLLRELASNAQHMVQNVTPRKAAWVEPLTVLYNPSIHREKPNLATRCMVACDGELVRKADYFRR